MAPVQQTIKYRTYLKEAVIEALRSVFVNHPDPNLTDTQVRLAYSLERANLAKSIIVRYYERSLQSAGVGHEEWQRVTDDGVTPELHQRFKHFLYKGDLEFEIVALAARDRDWMADALVNIIGMGETESYMQSFLNRVYNPNIGQEPESKTHAINLKTDDFTGTGDQEGRAPWLIEDVYVYRTSYRVEVFGEFYSRQVVGGTSYGMVTNIEVYPWMTDIDPMPNPNPEDPGPWVDLTGLIVE
jgi:hypothetical protein